MFLFSLFPGGGGGWGLYREIIFNSIYISSDTIYRRGCNSVVEHLFMV